MSACLYDPSLGRIFPDTTERRGRCNLQAEKPPGLRRPGYACCAPQTPKAPRGANMKAHAA